MEIMKNAKEITEEAPRFRQRRSQQVQLPLPAQIPFDALREAGNMAFLRVFHI